MKRSTRPLFLAGAALVAGAAAGAWLLWSASSERGAKSTARQVAGETAPPPSEPRPSEPPPAVAARAPALDLGALVTRDPNRVLKEVRTATPQTEAEARRLKVLEVRALVGLGRIGSARSEAARYYERWPDGPDVRLLEQLTGRHPTPAR